MVGATMNQSTHTHTHVQSMSLVLQGQWCGGGVFNGRVTEGLDELADLPLGNGAHHGGRGPPTRVHCTTRQQYD